MSTRLRFYLYLLIWLAAPWPLLAERVVGITNIVPLFVLHMVLISGANLVWDTTDRQDGEALPRFSARLAVGWIGNLLPVVIGVIAFGMIVGDFHGSSSESISIYLLVLIAATVISMACSTMTTPAQSHAEPGEAQEWGARSVGLGGVLLPWSATLVVSDSPGFEPLILLAACACSANIVSALLSPSVLKHAHVPAGTRLGLITTGLALIVPAFYVAFMGLVPPLLGSTSTISLPILTSLALFSLVVAGLFYRGSTTFARIQTRAH